jgi:hypothetical protein
MRRPAWIPAGVIPKPLRAGSLMRRSVRLGTYMFGSYGWVRSVREGRCVDRQGNPIPWYTYPAIDFLKQLDYSERTVFEYGAGFSTLFWAARAHRVTSIELDPDWYETLLPQVPENCELVLSPLEIGIYSRQISERGLFDVIVVDGGPTRPPCCMMALSHVKPGGMVILDNSDQCPQSASILRDSGLIQADFTGFAPLNEHAHTTSIFFTREYNFGPTRGFQPHPSVAQPYGPWPNEG